MTGRMCILFFLLSGFASAQFDETRAQAPQDVKVRIAFTTGGPCDPSVHILMIGINGPVGAGLVNDKCIAEFSSVAPGTYSVTISGKGISTVDTTLVVDHYGNQDLEVMVERNGEAGRAGGSAEGSLVAAADLQIPSSARKQYDQATQLLAKKDWGKAMEKLDRAIAIYPDYAAAYNARGVAYAHMGDPAHEREALLKAIGINSHFAPAYMNIGRLGLKTGNYPEAEEMLKKASVLEPAQTETLVLLAYAQMQDRHFDEAIATCGKAHAMAPAGHAFAHRIAAEAWKQQQRSAEERAELQLFLQEEPTGQRADAARAELAGLQPAAR